jgi:transposase
MLATDQVSLLRAENAVLSTANRALQAQLDQARQQAAALTAQLAHAQQQLAAQQAQLTQDQQQLAALTAQVAQGQQQIADLTAQLTAAQAELEELRASAAARPAVVKPPAPPRERKPRRKRAPQHNHGRHRDKPTRFVQHALDECPDCGYKLRGRAIARRRQVVDLPAPAPVDVSEHQIIKRWCPHCQRWVLPQDVVAGLVVGQGRLGVRVSALIAYLYCMLRLPIRLIRRYLETMHNLRVSSGEIVELLHRLYVLLKDEIAKLAGQARASPILHADETGWRQNGQNGYIWAFSTPEGAGPGAVRYYEYDRGRGQAQVKRLLRGFKGLLVSDFLSAYNIYPGKHQRCWVHLLRDMHELGEKYPADKQVQAWLKAVRDLYKEAAEFVRRTEPPSQEERELEYIRLVERVHVLGLQYAEAKQYKAHPCYALCKRLLRHEMELFQFVLVVGLSANNNQAERSIRPLVVIRKISGGSRSDKGTTTRLGLFSLLETWRVRGLNPFEELVKLLSQQASSAPV